MGNTCCACWANPVTPWSDADMADAPRVPFFCPAGAAFGVDLAKVVGRLGEPGEKP